jgi:hypothetical protein
MGIKRPGNFKSLEGGLKRLRIAGDPIKRLTLADVPQCFGGKIVFLGGELDKFVGIV